MKTLEEVIKGFECCQNVECNKCPYKILFNDDTHVPCDQLEKEDDALHYLNEYRTLQYGYIKAMADLEDNPPLTWDELKTMEGKPVWVESSDSLNRRRWMFVGEWFDDDEMRLFDMECDYPDYVSKNGYESGTWQAYRKER